MKLTSKIQGKSFIQASNICSNLMKQPYKGHFIQKKINFIQQSTRIMQRIVDSIKILIDFTFLVLLLLMLKAPLVNGGCREEKRDKCEAICTTIDNSIWDVSARNCTLRAVVILPLNTSYEASLPKVLPVLKLAENRIRELELLPHFVNFKWIPYDDKCDASYATISAMDGYGKDCAHVLFGPTCDYALASVSRIAKYFRSEGTPLISVGGLSFNFEDAKTNCLEEYYMLIRAGMLSFNTIGQMLAAVFKKYNWSHAVFFHERNGQWNVAGLHTCHLMMNTLAKVYRDQNITYSSFTTDSGTGNMTEDVKREVGLDHGGCLCILCKFIIVACCLLVSFVKYLVQRNKKKSVLKL